jgi:hypothetical protein
MRYKINEYRWSKWSEWENSSVLIVINTETERITIYSKATQIYDIVEYEGKERDYDGDTTLSCYCVNKDGLTCRIRLVGNPQIGRNQLYVDFDDMSWVYNVYNI